MKEPWGYYAKWNKLVLKGQIPYNTHIKYLKGKIVKTQKKWLPKADGGRGKRQLVFNGYRVFCKK